MIVLAAFLAGMAFIIAVAACVAAHRERTRAQSCERALSKSMEEQGQLLLAVSRDNRSLEAMIRAVAEASIPPAFPVDQSKVFISVPGPRTRQ